MIDIIVCFCNKDYNLIDGFIKSINLSMGYNLVFVDDRIDKSVDLRDKLKGFDYLIPPEKLGTFEARRFGFNNSKSDYVWFVDIDDELLDFNFIENGADVNIFNFVVNSIPETDYKDIVFISPKNEIKDKLFEYGLWNKIFKRSVLEKVFEKIPFIKDLCFLDDTYLNKSFMFFARKIFVNNQIIYNYKCKNRNDYRFKDHKESVNYLLSNCADFMKEYFYKLFEM
jgi:glycosyltransferase involved in cell wall biosynthesis